MENSNVQPKIYPGIICGGAEIFNDGQDVKLLFNGKVSPFSAAPFQLIDILSNEIEKDPAVSEILEEWYPNSVNARIEKYASCRFGGLDFQADITKCGVQDGEYHNCPLVLKCKGAGIVCKMPNYKGKRLNSQYVGLMKLLCTTSTNEAIASDLRLPMGTYHLLKKKLYALLEVQTKQEIALISRDLNIV